MRPTSFFLAAVIAAAAQTPALAETVTTIQGGDKRLYVRQVSSEVMRGGAAWDRSGGAASVFAGTVHRVYVTKGEIVISDERFFELLNEGQATRQYAETFKGRARSRTVWTWGAVAFGGLAFANGWALDNSFGPAPDALPIALGMAGLGLAAGGLTVAMWDLVSPPRHFTTEEAVEAVEQYNSAL